MKIGLVTFSVDKRNMAGIITAPLYFEKTLNEFCEAQIISLQEESKYSVYPETIRYMKPGEKKSSILNEYDFIIFMTPGYLIKKKDDDPDQIMYADMLNDLTTPFAIVINEERDGQLYFHFDEFIKHPYYSLLILNSEGMHEDFEYLYPQSKAWFELNFTLPMSKDKIFKNIAEYANRENNLVNTQRWVPRKRIAELINITPQLATNGIKTYLYGDRKVYFYYKDLVNKNIEFWYDGGGFVPEDLPEILKPMKYLYNFVYVARESKHRKMRGRLELVTIEGIMNGVLPVLCSQTVPSWIGSKGKSAIVLDKEDLNKLPEILGSISNEEWSERFTNFFNEVQDNIYNKYPEFIKVLEGLCDICYKER